MSPDINAAERQANELLLKQQQDLRFPLDVRTLSFDGDIRFVTMQDYCRVTGINLRDLIVDEQFNDGMNIVYGETSIILYNESIDSSGRINWTLAHELGHIILKHKSDDEPFETEAHLFAGKLLVPDTVLCELFRRGAPVTPDYIAAKFGLSKAAAATRLRSVHKRLASDYARSRINDNFSDAILHLFMPYINRIAPIRPLFLQTDDDILRAMNYM